MTQEYLRWVYLMRLSEARKAADQAGVAHMGPAGFNVRHTFADYEDDEDALQRGLDTVQRVITEGK